MVIRTRRVPKSMIKAVASSWTLTTRPRPCVSCVTWSCSANCSAGGAGGAAGEGVVWRVGRGGGGGGVLISSMGERESEPLDSRHNQKSHAALFLRKKKNK